VDVLDYGYAVSMLRSYEPLWNQTDITRKNDKQCLRIESSPEQLRLVSGDSHQRSISLAMV
jgi:hypothetical protein